MNIDILISDETARLKLDEENNLSLNAALRKAKEMYKEKAPYPTVQSKDKEHNKNFNNIISNSEDIDNGEVFDRESGQTIRDL